MNRRTFFKRAARAGAGLGAAAILGVEVSGNEDDPAVTEEWQGYTYVHRGTHPVPIEMWTVRTIVDSTGGSMATTWTDHGTINPPTVTTV